MLAALLADLLALPGIEVLTTRDPRLPPVPDGVVAIPAEEDIWPVWGRCIEQCDAVWPIAPETDGALERISFMVSSGKLLGCTPEAVRIASSKWLTAQHLAQAGVPVVPTWRVDDFISHEGQFVAKPDDGVGCEDTWVFSDVEALHGWVLGKRATHVVQPWLNGAAASLSMICYGGRSRLLSCNRQLIEVLDGRFCYRGSLVNGMVAYWDEFERLAQQVALALPGLAGYVGVDVMVDGDGVTVLEINPRLTTSYVGLHRAIDINPAGLVMDLLYNDRMIESAKIQRNVVEVRVDG